MDKEIKPPISGYLREHLHESPIVNRLIGKSMVSGSDTCDYHFVYSILEHHWYIGRHGHDVHTNVDKQRIVKRLVLQHTSTQLLIKRLV